MAPADPAPSLPRQLHVSDGVRGEEPEGERHGEGVPKLEGPRAARGAALQALCALCALPQDAFTLGQENGLA